MQERIIHLSPKYVLNKLSCRKKKQFSACATCAYGGGNTLCGVLFKGSYPVFTRVSENTTENSERPGRQARPGFEPGTSCLPVLSVTAVPLVGRCLLWKVITAYSLQKNKDVCCFQFFCKGVIKTVYFAVLLDQSYEFSANHLHCLEYVTTFQLNY